MKETLLAYEATTGARINIRKSRVLALGTWDMTRLIMNIPYHKDIKILGFQFTGIVHSTAIATWSSVTGRVPANAQETYYRDLSMDRRIKFVHEYLLSKIWYVTQIFPPHRLTLYDRLIPQYLGLYGGGNIQSPSFHSPAWEN